MAEEAVGRCLLLSADASLRLERAVSGKGQATSAQEVEAPQLGPEAAGLGILSRSFPNGPQAGPHPGPPSQLCTARSPDFHVHIPEELKGKVLSLMTSTFLFELAPGDIQADSSLGTGPRKGPRLVLSCW